MKKTVKILITSILAVIFVLTNVSSALAKTNELNSSSKPQNSNSTTYVVGNTKIVTFDGKNSTRVEVYENSILNHVSTVDKITGNITEDINGIKNTKNISQFLTVEKSTTPKTLTNISYVILPPEGGGGDIAPAGFYFMDTWYGYIGAPYLTGYLWGRDSVSYGPAKHLQFSTGTIVGTIVGIIIGLIPGVNAIAIITALGGGISGAIIGSYIDGNIYAVDYYKDLKVTVKNILELSTYRFTRYARVLNYKTGKVENQYVGKYGNWNENSSLIYNGVVNYVATH